jgi:ribosomal protein S18 acetylase RimI-like enzyme
MTESSSMNIRAYEASDQNDIVALWRECGLVVAWNDPIKDIARKLTEKRELFLVGERNGIIVACVMAGYEGHRGWINYLAVAPKQQRQGLGQRMVREVESRLLAIGCPKINLLIRNTNDDVIRFYARIGYAADPAVCLGKRLIPDD